MKLQQLAEEKVSFLITFILVVISVGLLVQIIPLFSTKAVITATEGVKPYTALQVAGRDIYVREGCYNCHSQQIRPFRAETERYGHYSVAGESVYDHPFQWGSKRMGPDLARVGGRYSDEWHRIHLLNPREIVPESNMPAFPWLARNKVNPEEVVSHMKALQMVGTPYTQADFDKAPEELKNKSELDAVIAYLQGLGLALKNKR
ncbi:cytochrome-c oxidase, cbb3-type subunit II [Kingella negevensis]|uniref:Cytochrome C oxidase, mono-heme subunit/FixO n=1 Tax=Kingella negevensis TaxID=1522312 RepID=A0A238HGH9_9NEIS|nr:cytochrome-c oxidase, cbb3-type subunit II [Kingella negevensis]MDK4683981.1 cytochrome-c oxidase, cbb3-type subunit II [Kingella negevensis]MDK4698309.1 cytochrome-c oxidase, cbb3-type subunit II [Kingella negevensis]MDK4707080.1 cytochrome-c oxidase, cbb3-type subunit II [Kingella negevensis]MDK4710660.1 cytochrome-c oxidase, cbb3-type subunit II [Kingella negevensis]SNB75996.1 Cytochrome C oxidase, mono-heme subunit/FixO [Kingella negevensis]